jgi:uncharacterized protein
MNYQGTQVLSHPAQTVWQALLDPQVLQHCIAGCERFERVAEDEFKSSVKIAIGPVTARFASTISLADVVAPRSCTLRFSGQGGVAGFGKGEARVRLTQLPEGTQLDWQADAHVGGKLAQIGSRLIEATVRKMSEDFFARFAGQLMAAAPPDALEPAPSPVAAPGTMNGHGLTKAGAWILALGLATTLAWWIAR